MEAHELLGEGVLGDLDAEQGDLGGVEGDLGSFGDRLGDLLGGFGEGRSPLSCLTLAGSVGEFPVS